MRALDAEDLAAGVGVRVEVDEADGAAPGGDGADVRLGDRVVAAEHDRQQAGVDHLADELLDRRVGARRVGGQDGRVAEVDDLQLLEGVDLRLEVRPGRARGGADRARPEAGAGPVGDEVVRRRADDRDVEPGQLGGILRVRRAAVGEQAGVVGLLAVLPPALERVDHGAIVACGEGEC